jgi:hypothetical protein
MQQFDIDLALMRAFAEAASPLINDEDDKRYLIGFLFGLGAAEEVGQFDPWPEPSVGTLVFLQDPFLEGAFDGRAGSPHRLASCALRR